ncbi:MAG: hypothetical protein ACPL0A_00570 [Candidatus Micrarchaeia archaeon]
MVGKMNVRWLVLAVLFVASFSSAAITSSRLVYLNGSTATLYYDTASSSYKDSSVANPNIYIELCADSAEDLLGNFTALYYRSGTINISISLMPANITSVNSSNCTVVDVDTSVYRAYYPGVVSVGFSSSQSMTNPVFYDLEEQKGLLSGEYRYTDVSNSTNTKIHLDKIYYSGTNEITTNKPYLIVSLWNSSGFINSTLVDRLTDAVFPLTNYSMVKVNNLTAGVSVPSQECTTDADCPDNYRCMGGRCVLVGGEEKERHSLYLSVELSGYVGDSVQFTVVDENDDKVRDAEVRVYKIADGYETVVDTCDTDSDGRCAVILDATGNYYGIAKKSGYDDSEKEYFMLWKRSMIISTEEYIYVNNPIEVSVKDHDTGNPLQGVEVELYSYTGRKSTTCNTGTSGKCTFSSSYFSNPGRYSVVGKKQYYNDGTAGFNVYLYPLDVDYPSKVYTRDKFDIEVRSLGKPVENARITFEDKKYFTDDEGMVNDLVFYEEGVYKFTVEKKDHETFEGSIRASHPPIYPIYPKEMYSKEKFILMVSSPSSDCISDVEVKIGDYVFYTDERGQAEVYVEKPNNYTLTLSKANCSPYKEIIEIPERPPEPTYEVIKPEKPSGTVVEAFAESLGLKGILKSGCEGFYFEGIPTIMCDFVWVFVLLTSVIAALLPDKAYQRLISGFLPIIISALTLPILGLFSGILLDAYNYRARAERKEREKELREKARKIEEELAAGKGLEEISREEMEAGEKGVGKQEKGNNIKKNGQ